MCGTIQATYSTNKKQIRKCDYRIMKTIQSIGFIGFGLIGGSVARLLREQSKSYDIFAYDHHIDRCNPGMAAALAPC